MESVKKDKWLLIVVVNVPQCLLTSNIMVNKAFYII